MPRKSTIIVLGSIVVLGAMLRGWQLGESLWLDELHTSWTISGSLSDVAPRTSIGNQSPLYFWLAWFFARLPLPGEIALRLPSMLAGCALPVALFWLAKELLPKQPDDPPDDTVPLLAAMLVAIDPRAIFYSQEARPYAILLLVAVFHVGLSLRLLERSTWPTRVLWVVTAALLVHLHYTGGVVLLAELVAVVLLVIIELRTRNSLQVAAPSKTLDTLANAGVDFSALALLLLPAIPGMLNVAMRRENWNHFVQPQPWDEILWLFPWTPAIMVVVMWNAWRPMLKQTHLVILTCWIFVPLIATWLTTQFDFARLFHSRYLIAVLPATLIAAAMCARLGVNAATQSILVGLILAIGVANSGILQTVRQHGKILHDRNEDWRGAIAALTNQIQRHEPVLLRSGLIEADSLADDSEPLFRTYCLYPVKGMYRLRPAERALEAEVLPLTTSHPGKMTPGLAKNLRGEPVIWLMVRTSQESVRQQLLRDLQESLEVQSIEAEEPQFFGNLYLQRIRLQKLPPR